MAEEQLKNLILDMAKKAKRASQSLVNLSSQVKDDF